MNIELKPRTTSFLVSAPATANDNSECRSDVGQTGRAVIYQPAKSAMTSGRAGTRRWVLEFEPQSAPFIDPLMGWTGSTDPMVQIRLGFPNRDAAVAYAERQGLAYVVREPAADSKNQGVGAAKLQVQQMPLWPIELLNVERSGFLIPEVATTDFAANFAAA